MTPTCGKLAVLPHVKNSQNHAPTYEKLDFFSGIWRPLPLYAVHGKRDLDQLGVGRGLRYKYAYFFLNLLLDFPDLGIFNFTPLSLSWNQHFPHTRKRFAPPFLLKLSRNFMFVPKKFHFLQNHDIRTDQEFAPHAVVSRALYTARRRHPHIWYLSLVLLRGSRPFVIRYPFVKSPVAAPRSDTRLWLHKTMRAPLR